MLRSHGKPCEEDNRGISSQQVPGALRTLIPLSPRNRKTTPQQFNSPLSEYAQNSLPAPPAMAVPPHSPPSQTQPAIPFVDHPVPPTSHSRPPRETQTLHNRRRQDKLARRGSVRHRSQHRRRLVMGLCGRILRSRTRGRTGDSVRWLEGRNSAAAAADWGNIGPWRLVWWGECVKVYVSR